MSPLFYLFGIIFCVVSNNDRDLIPDAIQLIYTIDEKNNAIKYNINKEALNIISTYMENDSIEIISLIGQARKGKSYTLSKIIQEISESSIIPFKSSDYNAPYTHGIWMYLLLKCSPKHNNIEIDSDGNSKIYPCSKDNKQYILLDIEGSYTDKDDEVMRYATIVTLISSQIFLFLHEKLYKHDIEHIRYIQTFIQQMNNENIEFNINDIKLNAIIREPFQNEFNNVEKAVNNDLYHYLKYFEGLDKFTTVQSITHFKDINYKKSINNLVNYISSNAGQESRMKFVSNPQKLTILLNEIINQFNNNPNISRVCIFCIFKRIVEWLPYGPFSKCSEKCGGGMQERYRECNTGKIKDCKQYIGGLEIERIECNTFKCEWLSYNEWSECSNVCKGGIQTRYRECSTGNIDDCIEMFGGNNIQQQKCNQQKCKWIDRSIGSCSNYICGKGEQKVYRYCESGNNKDCDGNTYKIQKCYNYFGCITYGIIIIIVLIFVFLTVYYWCKENIKTVMNIVCIIIVAFVIMIFLYLQFG